MPGFLDRVRRRRPTGVGLALGSGAARGWAHIGVIRALLEADIKIDYVAGTSIGALVGAALAGGELDALERMVRELDWKGAMSLLDIGLPRSGLIDGEKLTAALRHEVNTVEIEALPIPFCAVATNLSDGSEVRIEAGDLVDAVRASISIAGVFTPVRRGEMLLVDGGILNPVPAGVVREMGAGYVIAVDVHQERAGFGEVSDDSGGPDGRGEHSRGEEEYGRTDNWLKARLEEMGDKLTSRGAAGVSHLKSWLAPESGPNIFEVVLTAIDIMETQIAKTRLAEDPPDLIIRPEVSDVRPVDFHRGEEAIDEGYRAAKEALNGAGPWI